MSTSDPVLPPQKDDPKGLFAVTGGVVIAAGALLLSTACCWAPALILSLGLGSAFGAFMGAKWYIVAAGVTLALAGLAWHLKRRNSASDCCPPG